MTTGTAFSPEEWALDEAMVAVWPSHPEGFGGTGDAENRTWDIVDPAVPSLTLARRLLTALRGAGFRVVPADTLDSLTAERRELRQENDELRAGRDLQSFYAAALMDAMHHLHEPRPEPGDECPVCRNSITQAEATARRAFEFTAETRPARAALSEGGSK